MPQRLELATCPLSVQLMTAYWPANVPSRLGSARRSLLPVWPVLAVKMTVDCPAPVGVTSPVGLTVATEALSVVQAPVSARPSDATAVICSVAVKYPMLSGEVTPTVKGVGVVGIGAGLLLPPHAGRAPPRTRVATICFRLPRFTEENPYCFFAA